MILKEISAMFKHAISSSEIEATFRLLETDGRIGKREIIKILVLLIKKEVEREQASSVKKVL